jgi:hypothetical protein
MKVVTAQPTRKSIEPFEIMLTLETPKEMLMMAAIFNSSKIANAGGLSDSNSSAACIRYAITEHLRKNGITDYYGAFTVSEVPDWANK